MSTIQIAKNSFQDGLIMDFSPSNTRATCMTSALNATLLTFNGNELSLQNDMGNGRVETARLPEGYIPVGTCEFGDIIYIVSYNPLTDKSLIGCFPSPERNISTKELGILNLVISAGDFQEFGEDNNPTGTLKTLSKRLILTNTLSPGDKYFIYATNNENAAITEEKLSGVGATKDLGLAPNISVSLLDIKNFPLLLKVSVVSFLEDGKIKYLDSSVKWYNDIGYFIMNNVENNGVPDIDLYRNILLSGYSIFQSKVSGKLGLYFELESIKEFSCSHDIVLIGEYKDTNTQVTYKQYAINLNIDWINDNKFINPSALVFSLVELENLPDVKDLFPGISGNPYLTKVPEKNVIKLDNAYKLGESNIYDYIGLKLNYSLNLTSEGVPISNIVCQRQYNAGDGTEGNLSDYYYNTTNNELIIVKDDEKVNYLYRSVYKSWNIIYIPYRNAEGLEIKHDIKLNYTAIPAMPYGKLDLYAKRNCIEFDKIGTGTVNLTEWKYYNTDTLSTLTFGLDIYPEPQHHTKRVVLCFYDNEGFAGAYNIENKNSYSGKFTEIIPLNNSIPNYKLTNEYKYKNELIEECENAEIKSNKLYLVKIIIEDVSDFNELSISKHIIERWFWSNTLFNEKYYEITDFSILKPELQFDCGAYYLANVSNLKPVESEIEEDTDRKVLRIKLSIEDTNISTSLQVGLQNNYNTFSLYHPKNSDGTFNLTKDGALTLVNININIPKLGIIKYPDTIEYKSFNGSNTDYYNLHPESSLIYTDSITKDLFKIEFNTGNTTLPKISYLSSNQEYLENQEVTLLTLALKDLYFVSEDDYKSVNLLLTLENYNYHKQKEEIIEKLMPALKPLIYNSTDLESYNLYYHDKHFYIKDLYLIAGRNRLTGSKSTVKSITINLDNARFNINSSILYSWNIGDSFGYLHSNLINYDLTLLENTKDGFYLWGIDYNEYNTRENENTEIAIVPNNDDIREPHELPIIQTNIDRYVTFPIDGDLRVSDRSYGVPLSKTYESFYYNNMYNMGNTMYERGFGISTMFGLALVHKGIWYTLNNVFNFKEVNNTGEVWTPSEIINLEIQYAGNLHLDKDTSSNYYIDNLGDDFMFINLTINKPGFFPVIPDDGNDYWYLRTQSSGYNNSTRNFYINYKGHLYKILLLSEGTTLEDVSLNRTSWFSGNLTSFADWDNPQLINWYNNNGIWEETTSIELKNLGANDHPITICIKDYDNDDEDRNLIREKVIQGSFNLGGIKFKDVFVGDEIERDMSIDKELYNGNTAKVVVFPLTLTFERTVTWGTGLDPTNVKLEYVKDESNTYNLYAYTSDGEDIVIPFSISKKNNYTATASTIKSSLPITPGDALVGLLNSIYTKIDNYTSSNPIHVDTIYTEYTTQYIKDISYQVYLKEGNFSPETILNIQDRPWKEYVDKICNDYADNKDTLSKNNNIQVTIGDCLKTIPIGLNISSPNIKQPVTFTDNCYILKEGEVLTTSANLETDAMYYLDANNNPKSLTLNFLTAPSKPTLENNIVKISNKNDVFSVNNISKSFKIEEGQLTLNKDYHTQDNMFQITLYHKNSYCIGIKDIPLKASLFRGTEILTTLNHIVAS